MSRKRTRTVQPIETPAATPAAPVHPAITDPPTTPAAGPVPPTTIAVVPPNADGIDTTASDRLMSLCGGCRLLFNWFGVRSKQIDANTRRQMAEAVGAGEDFGSASKRLGSSKHPAIKEANELKARIEGVWKGMTLPLAGVARERRDLSVEPGVRLIKRADIPAFRQRMEALQVEAVAVERRVNASLADIKSQDRVRLKTMFNDDDYPSSVQLSFDWGFPAVAVPSYLKEIDPVTYERERTNLRDRFERTFEVAYLELLGQFQSVVTSWVDRLGPVTRIYPPEGHGLWHMYEAEVISADTQPDGKVVVTLKYKPQDSSEYIMQTLSPIPRAEYQALNPSTVAGERRVFRDTTIEAMGEMLARFRSLGSVVSASPELTTTVAEVEKHLAQLPTISRVTEELKDSETFRRNTHQLMAKVNEQLTEQVTNFRAGRRRVARGAIKND